MTHKYNSIQLRTVGKHNAQHIQTKISRPTMKKKKQTGSLTKQPEGFSIVELVYSSA